MREMSVTLFFPCPDMRRRFAILDIRAQGAGMARDAGRRTQSLMLWWKLVDLVRNDVRGVR